MQKQQYKSLEGRSRAEGRAPVKQWTITVYPHQEKTIMQHVRTFGCARTDVFHLLIDCEIRHPRLAKEFKRRMRQANRHHAQKLSSQT